MEADQLRADQVLGPQLLFRGIDAGHRPSVGAEPCRSRRQPEWLPSHLIGAHQKRAAHVHNHCILRAMPVAVEARPYDHAFFGHPRGLSVLFFTEMWERFSYYGMRALLILFMTAPVTAGGLGFDTGVAGAVYGLYTSMVYMTSLPGGWIADRLIGPRPAVLYGALIIPSRPFALALQLLPPLYIR